MGDGIKPPKQPMHVVYKNKNGAKKIFMFDHPKTEAEAFEYIKKFDDPTIVEILNIITQEPYEYPKLKKAWLIKK